MYIGHDSIAYRRWALVPAALLAASLLGSPGYSEVPGSSAPATTKDPDTPTEPQELDIGGIAEAAAEADLKVEDGSSMKGDARFEQVESGVNVLLEVDGAPPGKMGVHVHEKGDCSDIAGKSMGEHFAPRGEPHGLPESFRHHIGDLGNIVVDDRGHGELKILAKGANLEKQDPMSFLNRAIVVHRGEDKGTQPSGDTGPPVACGVIEEG